MDKFDKLVTMVMTTYNNWDFTRSCIFAFKRFYPGIRIVLADGGSTDNTLKFYQDFANDIVYIPEGKIEDCRNAGVALVDTPYTLIMDNDAKVMNETALPLLFEVFERFDFVAQTGAYCVKVVDFDKKIAFCSDEFIDYMECDWCPAYFSLHKTEAWKKIGGQPKEWYYGNPSFKQEKMESKYNNGGDASISKYYQKAGYKIYTPKTKIPVLHWVGAAYWSTNMEIGDWWSKNHKHIRVNPLNKWKEIFDEKNSFIL